MENYYGSAYLTKGICLPDLASRGKDSLRQPRQPRFTNICEGIELHHWAVAGQFPNFFSSPVEICNNSALYAYRTCRGLRCTLVLRVTHHLSTGFGSPSNPVLVCNVSIIPPSSPQKISMRLRYGRHAARPCLLEPRRALGLQLLCSLLFVCLHSAALFAFIRLLGVESFRHSSRHRSRMTWIKFARLTFSRAASFPL